MMKKFASISPCVLSLLLEKINPGVKGTLQFRTANQHTLLTWGSMISTPVLMFFPWGRAGQPQRRSGWARSMARGVPGAGKGCVPALLSLERLREKKGAQVGPEGKNHR